MTIPNSTASGNFGNGLLAPATVDGHTSFDVTQTTGSLTLTQPNQLTCRLHKLPNW